jgi:uncharacterized membrane protein YraQ (UPF0718 family)
MNAEPSAVDRFIVIFPSIVFEALPFIILGALISGTLEELLPQKWFARVIPRRRWLAIAGSALLGLVFPMCECGIVPVMRRLLGKGLPLGCAVAYMLAAPIINPVVIASTWAAFSGSQRVDQITSGQMVTLRVGLAFITAFIVGTVINRLARRRGVRNLIQPIRGAHQRIALHEDTDDEPISDAPANGSKKAAALELAPVEAPPAPPVRLPWGQRFYNISEVALHDFIDITCYLILGALLASLVQTFNLVQYAPGLTNPVLAVVYMMVLAVLLCLCSEADAFVAANLLSVPLGGKVAFLVLGPMLDLKLFFMYTRVFRARLIWTIISCVVVIVFILAIAAHYLNNAATPR